MAAGAGAAGGPLLLRRSEDAAAITSGTRPAITRADFEAAVFAVCSDPEKARLSPHAECRRQDPVYIAELKRRSGEVFDEVRGLLGPTLEHALLENALPGFHFGMPFAEWLARDNMDTSGLPVFRDAAGEVINEPIGPIKEAIQRYRGACEAAVASSFISPELEQNVGADFATWLSGQMLAKEDGDGAEKDGARDAGRGETGSGGHGAGGVGAGNDTARQEKGQDNDGTTGGAGSGAEVHRQQRQTSIDGFLGGGSTKRTAGAGGGSRVASRAGSPERSNGAGEGSTAGQKRSASTAGLDESGSVIELDDKEETQLTPGRAMRRVLDVMTRSTPAAKQMVAQALAGAAEAVGLAVSTGSARSPFAAAAPTISRASALGLATQLPWQQGPAGMGSPGMSSGLPSGLTVPVTANGYGQQPLGVPAGSGVGASPLLMSAMLQAAVAAGQGFAAPGHSPSSSTAVGAGGYSSIASSVPGMPQPLGGLYAGQPSAPLAGLYSAPAPPLVGSGGGGAAPVTAHSARELMAQPIPVEPGLMTHDEHQAYTLYGKTSALMQQLLKRSAESKHSVKGLVALAGAATEAVDVAAAYVAPKTVISHSGLAQYGSASAASSGLTSSAALALRPSLDAAGDSVVLPANQGSVLDLQNAYAIGDLFAQAGHPVAAVAAVYTTSAHFSNVGAIIHGNSMPLLQRTAALVPGLLLHPVAVVGAEAAASVSTGADLGGGLACGLLLHNRLQFQAFSIAQQGQPLRFARYVARCLNISVEEALRHALVLINTRAWDLLWAWYSRRWQQFAADDAVETRKKFTVALNKIWRAYAVRGTFDPTQLSDDTRFYALVAAAPTPNELMPQAQIDIIMRYDAPMEAVLAGPEGDSVRAALGLPGAPASAGASSSGGAAEGTAAAQAKVRNDDSRQQQRMTVAEQLRKQWGAPAARLADSCIMRIRQVSLLAKAQPDWTAKPFPGLPVYACYSMSQLFPKGWPTPAGKESCNVHGIGGHDTAACNVLNKDKEAKAEGGSGTAEQRGGQ